MDYNIDIIASGKCNYCVISSICSILTKQLYYKNNVMIEDLLNFVDFIKAVPGGVVGPLIQGGLASAQTLQCGAAKERIGHPVM